MFLALESKVSIFKDCGVGTANWDSNKNVMNKILSEKSFWARNMSEEIKKPKHQQLTDFGKRGFCKEKRWFLRELGKGFAEGCVSSAATHSCLAAFYFYVFLVSFQLNCHTHSRV